MMNYWIDRAEYIYALECPNCGEPGTYTWHQVLPIGEEVESEGCPSCGHVMIVDRHIETIPAGGAD